MCLARRNKGNERSSVGAGTERKHNMKHKSFRTMLSMLLCAAMLLSMVAMLSGCTRSGKNDSPALQHKILHYYSEKDSTSYFFVDGKKLEDRIGSGISTFLSVDGTSAAVIAATALYRVDANGIILVYPAAVTRAVLSMDGKSILFATATKAFLYSSDTGETTEFEGIEAETVLSLALSEDAKTAAVTVGQKGGRTATYICSEGKAEKNSEDTYAVAISNGAERMYCLEYVDGELTGRLHFVQNGKDSVISTNASHYFEVNRDATEITFDVKSKTHYSAKGSEAKQLVDASALSLAGAQYSTMGGSECTVLLKNAGSLFNSMFYTEYNAKDSDGNQFVEYDLYFVNSSKKAVKLVGGATQFTVQPDGTSVYCVVDSSLYTVSAFNPKKPELVESNVYAFGADEGFKNVYLTDIYGNVRLKKDGAAKLSDIILMNISHSAMMNNGTLLCIGLYDNGGTLCSIKGTESKILDEDVYYFEVYGDVAAYYKKAGSKDGLYDVYMSEDGENFTLCVEQAAIGGKAS